MAKGKYLLHSKIANSTFDYKNIVFVNDEWLDNMGGSAVSGTASNLLELPAIVSSLVEQKHGDSDWFIAPINYIAEQIPNETVLNMLKTLFPNATECPFARSYTLDENGNRLNGSSLGSSTGYYYCWNGNTSINEGYNGGCGTGVTTLDRNTSSNASIYSPYYTIFQFLSDAISVCLALFSENIIVNGKYDFTNKVIRYGKFQINVNYRNGSYNVQVGGYNYSTINTSTATYKLLAQDTLQNTDVSPISSPTDISTCTIADVGAYIFTGSAIIPNNIYVFDGTTQLTENVDYTVAVTNNIEVGQANINIAGIGNYTGTKQVHFNINRRNIDEATITVPGSPFDYTGSEITPAISATFNSYILIRAEDYVLRYSDNVNIGTASIEIDCTPSVELGTGNFTGSRTVTFQITSDDEPYNPGGTTTPEFGPTEGDWTLINNPISTDRTVHEDIGLGLFRVFAMDKNQLSNFAKTLWRPTILQVIKLNLSNPLDTIISLGSFPFIVGTSNPSIQIDFNWIDEWIPDEWQYAPTGYPLSSEYQSFTFGTITVPRYSGTFYDYQPYSQAQIYVPYIGYVNVKVNEILDKTIELKYHVNLITGDFTAILALTNSTAPQILGEYQGNMLRQLPLSMSSFVDFVGTAIKTAAIVGGIAASGMASSAALQAATISINSNLTSAGQLADMRNNPSGFFSVENQIVRNDARLAQVKQSNLNRTVSAGASGMADLVASANQHMQRNGQIGPVSGRTSTQEAFLVLSLPHQNIPSNQKMMGYPTNLPGPLSNYSGYTVVRDIHVKSGTALYSEIVEIEKILRGGIVI